MLAFRNAVCCSAFWNEMQTLTALDKALDVLFHLGSQGEPQGVSAIGRALRLPKSSAHRLLSALKRRDLVEQDASGRYRAGVGLLGLATGVPLVAAARPVLEQAAAALGETFFLVVARAGRLVVLDKAEGSGLLRGSPQVGGVVPVHATAVGKLYLAHAARDVQLERPLVRYTQRTIVSAARLAREVGAAKSDGYALSHGEWIDGLSVTAAPVMRASGLIAVVCAAVPSVRQPLLGERVVEQVKNAASAIAARVGAPV
jgi:DNA-binding IclR family transcriptional regulator